MRYTTILSDYRKNIWRKCINPDKKLEWKEHIPWVRNFLSGKDIRFIYKKDYKTIKKLLLKKLDIFNIELTDSILTLVDKTSKDVSKLNDPEFFATKYLNNSKLELNLLRDFSYGDKKGTNFNIMFIVYDKNDDEVFCVYWRDIFGARHYNDEKMLEGFRNSFEENYGKIRNWGDLTLDATGGTLNGSNWEISDEEDVSDFWSFIRKNLPTKKERREEKIDTIIPQ